MYRVERTYLSWTLYRDGVAVLVVNGPPETHPHWFDVAMMLMGAKTVTGRAKP